jgi:hypothetical protein
MTMATELMAAGEPAGVASQIGQGPVSTIAGAGTTQGTATAVVSSFTIISTAPSSSGVILKAAGAAPPQLIYNGGANTLKIYGNGSNTINGIAGSTGVSLPTLKAAILVASGTGWIAVISA